MMIRTIALLSATTLALAACGPKATTTTGNDANMAAAAPMNDTGAVAGATPVASGAQAFANTAAASDMFEIESSKMAAMQASSAKVKAFATQMIAAHEKSTAKLKETAASLSPAIVPDATLNADQQGMLASLKPLNGAAFDTAYATNQTAAHQATLDALKAYAATGDQPKFKDIATGLIPTVTAHLNMAKGLK